MAVVQPKDNKKVLDLASRLSTLNTNEVHLTTEQRFGEYLACCRSLDAGPHIQDGSLLLVDGLQGLYDQKNISTQEEAGRAAEVLSEVCRLLEVSFTSLGDQQTPATVAFLQAALALPAAGLTALDVYVKSCLEVGGLANDHLRQVFLTAIHACLTVMGEVLFSIRWLEHAGTEVFTVTGGKLRGALKDAVVPIVCFALTSIAEGKKPAAEAGDGRVELRLVFDLLVQLGIKCAHAISGSLGELSPKEFRSFGTLNAAWGAVIKVLGALPGHLRGAVLSWTAEDGTGCADMSVLVCALAENTEQEFKKLMERPDNNQLQVFRFWMQALVKVLMTFPEVLQNWPQPLVGLASSLLDQLAHVRLATAEEDPLSQGIQSAINRYIMCLVDLLAYPDTGPRLAEAFTRALCPSDNHAFPASEARGRLRIALELLRHGPKATNEGLQTLADHVLPWTFDMAVQIYPDCCEDTRLQQEFHSAVTTFVCTACYRGGSSAWIQCQEVFFGLTCNTNPFLQYLLAQVWASVLSSATPDVVRAHICFLHQLIHVLAGTSFLPGSSEVESRLLLEHVVDLGAHLLGSCEENLRDDISHSLLEDCLRGSRMPASAIVTASTVHMVSLATGKLLTPEIRAVAMELLTCMIKHGSSAIGRQCSVSLTASMNCIEELLGLLGSGTQESKLALDFLASLADQLDFSRVTEQTVQCGCTLLRILALLDSNFVHTCASQWATCALVWQEQAQGKADVAAFAALGAEFDTAPEELFAAVLTESHWALRFAACQSLVHYARSPSSGDFRRLIPPALLQQADQSSACGNGPPFLDQLKQHVQRIYTPSEQSMALDPWLCRQQELANLSKGQSSCLAAACQNVACCLKQAANEHLSTGDNLHHGLPEAITHALQGLETAVGNGPYQPLSGQALVGIEMQLKALLRHVQQLKAKNLS